MRVIVTILLVFTTSISLTQSLTKQKGVSLGLNYIPNKILLHKPDFHVEKNAYPQALEFSIKRQTLGSKQWHQKYGFPEVGLSFIYSNYNFKPFGQVIGFYPSIQFRIKSFKNSNVFFKVGGGLGISSKHWNRDVATDSFRYFIGSALNNFTMFQIGYLSKINNNWTAQIGIDFYHVSNAATRQPNYGINTTGLFLGLNYYPNSMISKFEKRTFEKQRNTIRIGIASSIAFVEAPVFNGPLFKVYSQSLGFTKKYRSKARAWLSLNAIFKTRTYAGFKNGLNDSKSSWKRTWQYSLAVKNEFLFGRVGLPLGLGYYLNDPTGNLKLFQSLGLNYYYHQKNNYLIKESYFSLILHTHVSKAQYAEMGIGFFF